MTIEALQNQLDNLAEEAKNAFPTPPVGTMVIWYPHGEVREGGEVAAVVTAIESPGKISLSLFLLNGVQKMNKSGVYYVGHPIHKVQQHESSWNAGGWDYIANERPPNKHKSLHLEIIAKKQAEIEKQLKAFKPQEQAT